MSGNNQAEDSATPVIPERIRLAHLPTPIEKLERLSAKLGGPDIYLKRDDQTGTEWSGNKIRKLEYSLQEALDQGADTLITCGGIQSNHCRATAAAAARLGLKAVLVLRGSKPDVPEGNLLLDHMLGAEIVWVTAEDYRHRRMAIMAEHSLRLAASGRKAYLIPEGASNAIGAFGYYSALAEITAQELEMGLTFDAIVVADGSGGTHAGLVLARKLLNTGHDIIGINVCDDADYFIQTIGRILEECRAYVDAPYTWTPEDIRVIDGYVGRGYALGRPEERQLIQEVARLEGVVFDPVYTGKAFYGLTEEIRKGAFVDKRNVLFIHTGGLYGLFPQGSEFDF
jgi:D-cysteine desulfhydrase